MDILTNPQFVIQEMRRIENHRTQETPLVVLHPEEPRPLVTPGPRERLAFILLRSDTVPVEVVLGLSGLLWGLWFLSPVGWEDVVVNADTVLLPSWGWGALFLLGSTLLLYGTVWKKAAVVRTAAMLSFLLWTFSLLASLFEIGIFVPTSLLFAVTAAWVYLRQGPTR